MEKILKNLNEAQKEAVKTIDGPLLILAGAGSGKTKTITSRLAYLLKNGIDPANTLTLTFTNKAAKEMRDRALSMIGNTIYPPLLCTFHKFGLLFLKFYIDRLNRSNSFVIIDTDDKKRVLKSFEPDIPISLIANEISKYKNSLIEPDIAIQKAHLPNFKKIAVFYKKYQEYLKEKNLVDFDDLLVLTYKILDEDENLCKEISQRYQYIMIDEYQDTNELQHLLIKKLCSTHNNICVVGDEDQSIYGWRGANIKNILEFHKQFPNTKIIKLEKNYRSTKNILNAANSLISYNKNRLGKKLEATLEDGEPIKIYKSQDEKEETAKIAKRVKELLDRGVDPKDIAVLFRINALSRSLEEGLSKAKIPYKLVGAMRFYERAEIKDIISYLRVIANPHDDFSLKRVINKPRRGLGKVTIEKIEKEAFKKKKPILTYLLDASENELISLIGKKNYKTIKEFLENLDYLKTLANESLYKFADELENLFGLREYYSSLPDGMERVLNIDEFYGVFRDFIKQNPKSQLDDFLNELSLQSDQDQIDQNSISIMSIHASKGLEFKYLFVIGLEEGFFPLTSEGSDIEEERRLGYVAITRAKKELVLSYAKSRFHRGSRANLVKSRFLKEAGLCKGSLNLEKSTSFKKGDLVKHRLFGIGRVTGVSKVGKEFKLSINFAGQKRDILASFVEKL